MLDTNVWLDWLVFEDPGIAPIKAAVMAGRAVISIDVACERELERVLDRPLAKKKPGACMQAARLEECRRLARSNEDGWMADGSSALPVCRDPDDQKFLELARACRADFLVTKDRALLELAHRKVRPAPFRIVTPRQLAAALEAY